MSESFVVENWVRTVSGDARARIASFLIRETLPALWPALFCAKADLVAFKCQGWTNITLKARCAAGSQYIIRFQPKPKDADQTKNWSTFHKEEWILRNLDSAVPTPQLINPAMGYTTIHGFPQRSSREYAYIIQTYLPYENALSIRDPIRHIRIMKSLSKISKRIHRTPTRGYGRIFDPETQAFTFSSWSELVHAELNKTNFGLLSHFGLVSQDTASYLTDRIYSLAELSFEPHLYHQDFIYNLGNVLIDDERKVKAVIDWDFAGSGPAFHYEVASTLYAMHRDGRSDQEIRNALAAILIGYEMSRSEYQREHESTVETLVTMSLLAALNKYLSLRYSGGLNAEPWRRLFALRAKRLLDQLPQKRSRFIRQKKSLQQPKQAIA